MRQEEVNGVTSAPSLADRSRIIGSGEMAERIRAFPWQDNSLGPLESWPAELTCIVNMMLANVEMAAVCWGPEKIFLCNDSYLPHLTDRHPAALGKPMWDTWREMTEHFKEMTDAPYKWGKSFVIPPVSVKLFRNGVLAEAYYSVTGNPIYALLNGRYGVVGAYFTYAEHTESVLQAERLMATQAASARLQKHLALAIESADLASWYYDPIKQELGGDKKLAEMYDFPEGPASASTWIERLVPEDQEHVTAALAAALTGAPYDVEFRVDVRGSIHWISSKGRLIEDEGKPLLIGICEDITAERSANMLVLASGQVASWDWNLQSGQVAWKGSEWAYGRPASALDTPEKCLEFVHPDDLAMLEKALSPAMLMMQNFDCEYRIIWPDKSVHWILGKGYSIEADPNGVPTRLIGVNTDVTQRLGRVVGLANHTILVRRDGSEVAIDDSAAPVHDAKGELCGAVLVFRDVTERRRTELNLEMLVESGTVLAETRDVRAITQGIGAAVKRHFADFCIFDLLTPSGELERIIGEHRDPAKQSVADGLCRFIPKPEKSVHPTRAALLTGKPILLNNITDEVMQAAAMNAEHLAYFRETLHPRSVIVVPMTIGEENLGAVSFLRTSLANPFEQTDLLAAEELVKRLAFALHYTRIREELVTQQAQLNAVFEAVPVGLILANASGQIVRSNGESEKVLGHTTHYSESTVDYAEYSASHPDGRPVLGDEYPLARALKEQRPVLDEHYLYQRGDGRQDWVSFSAVPVNDAEGRSTGAVVTISDIDKLTRAHLRLRTRSMTWWSTGQNGIRITVADTGSGISPEVRGRIFDAFFTTKGIHGTGLGLWISRRIVHKHRGHVRVKSSTKGGRHGSVFILWLPLELAETAREAWYADEGATNGHALISAGQGT